jgi:hypothetical protein
MTLYSNDPFYKHPEAERDIPLSWAEFLTQQGATIVDSEWTVDDDDLEIVSDDISGTSTVVRVAGGVERTSYYLQNRITLSDGQHPVEEIEVVVTRDMVPA